jgi:type I restriction enzyme S subunit
MSNKAKTTNMKKDAKPTLVPKLRFPEFRDAEGWDADGLGEVADFVNEKIPLERVALENYVSTENILPDYGGIARASKLPTTGSVTRYRPNDTLVSNIRPYLKKIWVADKEGGASNDVIVIRAKQRLLPQYFSCLLKNDTFIDYVMTGAKGVKMPRGDIGLMKEYPTLYPTKPEQQKIAECLSSVDELIAAEVRKLDALKAHKKGLMQQLFPRPGETRPRLRFPEFRDKPEWAEHALIDIATFRRGSFPQPYGLPEWYDEEDGMPFIQVFDVGDDFRLKEKTKSKISKLGAEKSVFIATGTLIVTLQGSIGRVAITQYDAYIDRTLLIFETFLKPIEKVFFARLIQNLFDVEKEIAPGGIIKTITKEALSDFKVKLPTISEQDKIADCLSTLDDLIAAQTQKLDALKTHKKGLMQQLFPSPEGSEIVEMRTEDAPHNKQHLLGARR